jgi:DNA uptake protein ComE-like DNA-binding protein
VPASEKKARSADRWLVERAGGKRRRGSAEASEAVDGTDPGAGETLPSDEQEEAQKPISPEASEWLVAPAGNDNGVTSSRTEDDAKGAEAVMAEQRRRPTPAADLAQGAENRELAKRISELETDLRTQAKEAKAELKRALKERDRELKDVLRQGEADAKERLAAIEMAWTKRLEGRESELQARVDDLEAKLAEATKRTTTRARRTSTLTRRKAATTTGSPKARTKASARSRKTATGRSPGGSRSQRRKVEKLNLNEATFEDLRALGLSVTQSARLVAYRNVREGYKSLDELDEIPGLSRKTRAELRAQLKLSG